MFYDETLRQLIEAGTISTSDKVLVVCGGSYDADVLKGLGFKSVTLSNLDGSYAGHDADYVWERQDTENLSYGSGEFDVVMVHAGLHHCASPHRALLEMYRVARKAAVVFEARDSLMMRTAVALGFTGDFELEAVSGEGYESGGLNNGPIPNLNFRWTEREVRQDHPRGRSGPCRADRVLLWAAAADAAARSCQCAHRSASRLS